MDMRGTCKKEIVRTLPLFTDRLGFLREFKINVGDYVSIEHNKEIDAYIVHKLQLTKKEVEEHFEIEWIEGCYNTCIRNGKPCDKIGHYIPDHITSKDKYSSNCCRIGWEIGRASCRAYEERKVQS